MQSPSAPEKTEQQATAAPSQEEAPKPVMPDLPNGPQSFFDTEKGVFWVGLPLKKIDYLTASALLDRLKIDILGIYNHARMQAEKNKLLRPDGSQFRNIFGRMNK